MKYFSLLRLWALTLCLCLLAACGGKAKVPERAPVESGELQFAPVQEGDTIAVFSTELGDIRAVLYPELAPMAVDNFTGLTQKGYYDGTVFHTVTPQYIQGGDASGTGNGSATIWNADSFPMEVSDSLRHYTGALCVAFDRDTGMGTGQFYFVTAPAGMDSDMTKKMQEAGYSEGAVAAYEAAGGLPQLDNTDTVFGMIYEGQAIADAIAAAEVEKDTTHPVKPVTVNTVTVTVYTTEGE